MARDLPDPRGQFAGRELHATTGTGLSWQRTTGTRSRRQSDRGGRRRDLSQATVGEPGPGKAREAVDIRGRNRLVRPAPPGGSQANEPSDIPFRTGKVLVAAAPRRLFSDGVLQTTECATSG